MHISRRFRLPSIRPSGTGEARRAGGPTGLKTVAAATAAAASLAVGLAGPAGATTTVTMPGGKIYAGAAGDVTTLQSKIGTTVGVHAYGTFEGSVPQGRMVTANTPASWSTVAAAKPGSALYNNIARWAKTLQSRGGVTLFAYSHEPELASKTGLGTADDFKAAYARVVAIFREQGATNVRFTLQLSAWAYRTAATDRMAAAKWYPGDAYVDVVGADAYNWSTCGEGSGKWVELSTLASPVVAFGKAHNKLVALPEFGATKDARRAQWLTNAKNYLVVNEGQFAAVYYFNRPPTNPKNQDCSWPLNTSAEYAAFGSMMTNTDFAP